jgi:hypothetical protein
MFCDASRFRIAQENITLKSLISNRRYLIQIAGSMDSSPRVVVGNQHNLHARDAAGRAALLPIDGRAMFGTFLPAMLGFLNKLFA